MEGTARQVADALVASRAHERAEQAFQLQCIIDLIERYQTVPALDVPGAEQLVSSGADGTPLVAEFLAAELAPLLQESIPSAWNLIHDAANLYTRHPRLWGAMQAGQVPVWQARKAAQACAEAGLGLAATLLVDVRLQPAWGRLPWGRIQAKLRGYIVDADKELALARAAAKKRERFVRITHDGDASAFLAARLDTADAVALGVAIDAIAKSLMMDGRPESLPELRALALGGLARPTDDGTLPRPTSTLVVHVARESVEDGDGVARIDGIGPLLLEQVIELLAHHKVRLLPVLDLAGDPSVDSYEIPQWMRTQVLIRDPYSRFPYSTSRSRQCDVDHTREFDKAGPPGQTRPSNLGPFGRREHRPKTFGGWQAAQPEPGEFHLTSPLGYRYRVDRHGSFMLDQHEPQVDEARPPASDSFAERLMLTTLPTLAPTAGSESGGHVQYGTWLDVQLTGSR